MASRKSVPGVETSEYGLAKYGSAVAVAAPILAALAAKFLDVEITVEQVTELAKHSIVAIMGIASAYAVGRSVVKSRDK